MNTVNARDTQYKTRRILINFVMPLTALLLFALWLRWRYVYEISLYVDEFTTLWAAVQVQTHGAPLLPSGVLYTRGLLASYVEAAFLTLFGFSYTVGRLPSVIFGLATIVSVFVVGRREWRAGVGWLAAVGLTLLPEAIIWSGRARFYAQLQFFVLLTVWVAYLWISEYGRRNTEDEIQRRTEFRTPHSALCTRAWLFVILFILALYSQEETILLYPALVLAWVGWYGWRSLLQGQVLVANLICLAAMGIRFVIEIWGQPGYFETIQAERPYIGLFFDWRGAWNTYSPLLIEPVRLPWTLLGLLAIIVALVAWARVRWRLADLPRFHAATLFFALHFYFVLAVIFIFVGGSWRDARYLFLVQPLWLLIGAAGAIWLVEQMVVATSVAQPRHVSMPLLALLTLIAGWSLHPAAQAVLTQQVEGYDRALAWLAMTRQAHDAVLSPQPPACALVLGKCDAYAIQQGYAEYVIRRNGLLVDRWTASPLLNTVAQLENTIRSAPRTWFVTDGLRLATRYEADFLRTIVEQFELAYEERGVRVLRADGWRTLPAPTESKQLDPPIAFFPLALTGWERSEAAPGQELHVTLFWRGEGRVDRQVNTSVKIVAADGELVQGADGPPTRGLLPTMLFFATPLPDLKTLTLPADLRPGRYRLDVSAYAVEGVQPLREPFAFDWFTVGPLPAAPTQPTAARWSNGLHLVGADTIPTSLHPGDTLQVRLVWTTNAPIEDDYTVFVHLVGAEGEPLAQSDRAPENGFYPTSAWDVGEWVEDKYTMVVAADTPGGAYTLVVGLYRPSELERLPLANGNDAFVLGSLQIVTTPDR